MKRTPGEDGSKRHDEVTAYHEAGHAVVAMALGRPVAKVSVLPKEHFQGTCHFGKGTFRPTEDWVEREILIALGGLAAEARHTGTYAHEEAGHDLAYVRRLALDRAGERRAERLERRLLAKVEHLLDKEENWRAVERIAAELVTRGSISGRTARHIFDEECRD